MYVRKKKKKKTFWLSRCLFFMLFGYREKPLEKKWKLRETNYLEVLLFIRNGFFCCIYISLFFFLMLHVVWLVRKIFPKEEENRISSKSIRLLLSLILSFCCMISLFLMFLFGYREKPMWKIVDVLWLWVLTFRLLAAIFGH